MVVENLRTFTVKSYKKLFKMYKNRDLGIVEQRMTLDLIPLKPSKNLSELECIESLLNEDDDNVYHVYFDGKKYVITILGFALSKIVDGKKQLIMFGEDGRWEEEAEPLSDEVMKSLPLGGDIWDNWQDSSDGTFEMWSGEEKIKHEQKTTKQ